MTAAANVTQQGHEVTVAVGNDSAKLSRDGAVQMAVDLVIAASRIVVEAPATAPLPPVAPCPEWCDREHESEGWEWVREYPTGAEGTRLCVHEVGTVRAGNVNDGQSSFRVSVQRHQSGSVHHGEEASHEIDPVVVGVGNDGLPAEVARQLATLITAAASAADAAV